MSRVTCFRCHKPEVTCICPGLTRVANRTQVLVLQHPREHLHPIGTARFARLGLSNVRVEVAWNAGVCESEPPSWLPADTALLYPAEHARDLRAIAREEQPKALLVLDGTWHTARTLYRDKRWLHALPHYRFLPAAPGRYRLRREPQLDYVSTIEAIVEALCILEPEATGFSQLLAAFDAMIDRQLAYIGSDQSNPRRRKRRRPEAERRLPHALVDGFEDMVVVYGESARPRAGEPREFAYFTALSLHTGARFDRLILPASGVPDPEHLRHMDLWASDFAAATGGASFGREWAQFLAARGARPVLAAWNQRTLDFLERATGTPVPPKARVVIKSAYRAIFGVDDQNLDAVVARHGLPLDLNGFRGRAGRRLAGAVAVVRLLRARANLEKNWTSKVVHTEPGHEQPTHPAPARHAPPARHEGD